MEDYSFIRFKQTLAEAIDLGESVEVETNYLGQIQLKPNDTKPYYQVTNTDFDFTYANDYEIKLVEFCSSNETDVTSSVTLSEVVINGVIQALVRITNLPKDYHNNLVYLRIDRKLLLSGSYYSNLFLVSNDQIEKTTRIDYIDNTRDLSNISLTMDFVQSIRLQMYFKNYVASTELDAYYQISTEQNVNSRIQETSLAEWYLPPINAWTFKRLEKACYNGGVWLNFVRQYFTNAIEYTPREDLSNVSEITFTTDPNENDILNVIDIYPIVVPMLSSSSRLMSSSQLMSEETTPI